MTYAPSPDTDLTCAECGKVFVPHDRWVSAIRRMPSGKQYEMSATVSVYDLDSEPVEFCRACLYALFRWSKTRKP
jgi:hypothetical protein